MLPLPDTPGYYMVNLTLSSARHLRVGELGEFDFPPGAYFYLGSARGPGGLRARLGRHLGEIQAAPHWHIDYLRRFGQVNAYCYLPLPQETSPGLPIECRWSQALAELPGGYMPAPGFGASDCRAGCPAHLVAFYPPVRIQWGGDIRESPPVITKEGKVSPNHINQANLIHALSSAAGVSTQSITCQHKYLR